MRIAPRSLAVSVSLLLTLATAAAAQVTLGVHGGVSIATLGGSDVSNADARTGINVGGAVTFPVAPSLGIQVGAGYVQKGATANSEGVDVEFALDYLEMPVLLRIGVPTTGSISPHFVVGPALSFKAKCEASGTGNGASVTVKCGDTNIAVKSIDVGGMAGAGLDIGTPGPVTITLDASYTLGFTSIDDASGGGDVKNRAWSILAGVAFPIG